MEQDKFLVECVTKATDWVVNAKTDGERKAAIMALGNLHTQIASLPKLEKPERKPRKKLTAVEKFDKKNSRREAILEQKERRVSGASDD